MALGDFNKDGFLDIAVANSGKDSAGTAIGSASVSILFGKGDGTFSKANPKLAGPYQPYVDSGRPGRQPGHFRVERYGHYPKE